LPVQNFLVIMFHSLVVPEYSLFPSLAFSPFLSLSFSILYIYLVLSLGVVVDSSLIKVQQSFSLLLLLLRKKNNTGNPPFDPILTVGIGSNSHVFLMTIAHIVILLQ
jgi:hypothetical protein